MTVVPSGAQLHFWAEGKNQDQNVLGGMTEFVRRFDILEGSGVIDDGVEVYLMPFALSNEDNFSPEFTRKFSKLKYKSVHFGGPTSNFLNEEENIEEQLSNFSRLVDQLEPHNLIIHAQHLRYDRGNIKSLFSKYLKNHEILVENESWYDPWACQPESLLEIFEDLPQFNVCLDVCHIADCHDLKLNDFIQRDEILKRIKQIHFSLSSRDLGFDPYEKKGFKGYGPNHALYAISDEQIDPVVKDFILNYPVIVEGVIPVEDRELNFVKNEFKLLKN